MTQSSKQPGAPTVVVQDGRILVVQRRTIGWMLLAFGLGAPVLVLATQSGFRRAPAAHLAKVFDDLEPPEAVIALLGALLLLTMTLYGLYWLCWTRHLAIDLTTQRLRWRTGLWPFIESVEASAGDLETIHLGRTVRFPRKPTGGGSTPSESWEVRLGLPGAREPLFLGEWGLRHEALAEIDRWMRLLPALKLVEEDPRPDIRRASK